MEERDLLLGFAAILNSPSPLWYFVLDFEWINPIVQNSQLRPWIRNKKYLFTFKDAQIISHSNYRTLSVVMMSFRKYCRKYFRPVEEGGWSSSYCKLRETSCFWILTVSVFRTDLMARLKGGRNPKTQQLPKIHISWTAGRRKLVDPSKWPQDFIYYGCSQTCIPLRRTASALKIRGFFCYFGAL